jgi:hypothetical protein
VRKREFVSGCLCVVFCALSFACGAPPLTHSIPNSAIKAQSTNHQAQSTKNKIQEYKSRDTHLPILLVILLLILLKTSCLRGTYVVGRNLFRFP